jgi:signal transduction histidine kinase
VTEVVDAAGLEAALEAGVFDLVITDCRMTWTDGLAVLRAVKARYPERPVIMLTPSESQGAGVAAMREGLDDYVVKAPRDLVRLPAAVRAALDRAEARRRAQAEHDAALAREHGLRVQAEEANAAKDQFLAILSHELRTPLTAIVGWVRLLRSGMLAPDAATRAIETVERNVDVQVRMVADLLGVSRIISGRLRLELEQIDIVRLVEDAIEAVRPAAQAKGVVIETSLSAAGGVVSGDPARLQQVLGNLLSNAVKFTPPGERITVSVARLDGDAQIRVTDTGRGIDPELLPNVFDRFVQGVPTRPHGGLGLGLGIARDLVLMHGGTLKADSEGVGRGATFTLTLPLLASPATGSSDGASMSDVA